MLQAMQVICRFALLLFCRDDSGECNGRVFLFYCALELFLQIKFYSFSENSFCIKIFLYESKNSEVLQSVLKSDYISVSTGSFEPG